MDEIKRALQECGRKLGIWIRKRQHAKNEFERRNIFQRYIEEVAESCKRIKGGKLDAEKLKKQLQRIAEELTGGEETDALLNKKKQAEEEELENTVILTPEGLKGDVPAQAAAAAGQATVISASPDTDAPKVETGELIAGATSKKKKVSPVASKETVKKIVAKGKKKSDEPGLFDENEGKKKKK